MDLSKQEMTMDNNSLYDKLESFSNLQQDLDGYEAKSISTTVINNTKFLLDKLKPLRRWEIFPTNKGIITVEKDLDKTFVIEIEVSESEYIFMFFKYNVEVGNNCYTIEKGNVYNINELDNLIQELAKLDDKYLV